MPKKGDIRYRSITISGRAYKIFEEEARKLGKFRANKPNVAMFLDDIAWKIYDKNLEKEGKKNIPEW